MKSAFFVVVPSVVGKTYLLKTSDEFLFRRRLHGLIVSFEPGVGQGSGGERQGSRPSRGAHGEVEGDVRRRSGRQFLLQQGTHTVQFISFSPLSPSPASLSHAWPAAPPRLMLTKTTAVKRVRVIRGPMPAIGDRELGVYVARAPTVAKSNMLFSHFYRQRNK